MLDCGIFAGIGTMNMFQLEQQNAADDVRMVQRIIQLQSGVIKSFRQAGIPTDKAERALEAFFSSLTTSEDYERDLGKDARSPS